MAKLSRQAPFLFVALLTVGEASPRFMRQVGSPVESSSALLAHGKDISPTSAPTSTLAPIPEVVMGGTDSVSTGLVTRPEHMVTLRRRTGTFTDPEGVTRKIWEACSKDDSDCWIPFSNANGGYPLVGGNLASSTYDKIAMEAAIQCDSGSGVISLKVYCDDPSLSYIHGPSSNSHMTVYYNFIDRHFELGTGCHTKADGSQSKFHSVRGEGSAWGESLQIPVSSSDAYKVLRIELAKDDASDSSAARLQLETRLTLVHREFDECMKEKTNHGVCLKSLPIGAPLRSNHTLQKHCLENHTSGAVTPASISGCTAWQDCLNGTNTSGLLLKIVKAADFGPMTASPNLLEKSKTRKTTNATVCNGDNSTDPNFDYSIGGCIDPTNFDIAAFDCSCYETIHDMTEVGLWEWTCHNPKVCCTWKEDHCDTSSFTTSSLLEQRSSKNIAVRSSLDESTDAKCS